jgi:ABC-type microcin C transport system permease subunit YejE
MSTIQEMNHGKLERTFWPSGSYKPSPTNIKPTPPNNTPPSLKERVSIFFSNKKNITAFVTTATIIGAIVGAKFFGVGAAIGAGVGAALGFFIFSLAWLIIRDTLNDKIAKEKNSSSV